MLHYFAYVFMNSITAFAVFVALYIIWKEWNRRR